METLGCAMTVPLIAIQLPLQGRITSDLANLQNLLFFCFWDIDSVKVLLLVDLLKLLSCFYVYIHSFKLNSSLDRIIY